MTELACPIFVGLLYCKSGPPGSSRMVSCRHTDRIRWNGSTSIATSKRNAIPIHTRSDREQGSPDAPHPLSPAPTVGWQAELGTYGRAARLRRSVRAVRVFNE